jgi:dihydroflavonol-4-reductase
MSTVFVTGASGFIAKHVLLKLLEAGHSVTGSLRNPDRADEVRAALRPALADRGAMDRLSFAALDLTRDEGWDRAMAGHDSLIHTASPFPLVAPKDPEVLIAPARDGTLRALGAARAAGIGRVVVTSSSVAVLGGVPQGRTATEADWTDPAAPDTSAYERSKTLAERAAWEFAEAHDLALTTINPTFVLDPPLDRHYGASVGLVRRLLRGKDPMLPKLGMAVVDVRDVAEMHLRAVAEPATAGMRFIAHSGGLWLSDMGRVLKTAYPERKMPTRVAPKFFIRLLALFDKEVRASLAGIDKMPVLSNARARDRMGMSFVPPEQALLASAAALIALGEV